MPTQPDFARSLDEEVAIGPAVTGLPTPSGKVEARMEDYGGNWYRVYFKDNQGNPQRKWFREEVLGDL